jgi:hypothetical protein
LLSISRFCRICHLTPSRRYIGSTVMSTGKTTVVNVKNTRLSVQPWAYNTLECYGCQSCSTYPANDCQFGKLQARRRSFLVVFVVVDLKIPCLLKLMCDAKHQIFKGTTQVTPDWRVTPKQPYVLISLFLSHALDFEFLHRLNSNLGRVQEEAVLSRVDRCAGPVCCCDRVRQHCLTPRPFPRFITTKKSVLVFRFFVFSATQQNNNSVRLSRIARLPLQPLLLLPPLPHARRPVTVTVASEPSRCQCDALVRGYLCMLHRVRTSF